MIGTWQNADKTKIIVYPDMESIFMDGFSANDQFGQFFTLEITPIPAEVIGAEYMAYRKKLMQEEIDRLQTRLAQLNETGSNL